MTTRKRVGPMASFTPDPSSGPPSFLGSVVGYDGRDANVASVRIRGALCALTAPEHARQLGDLVDQGYIRVRVELDELSLCTSHGLDLWDDLQHRLDPLEGRLVLAGATGVVRRVLDVVTRPEGHFCPTVELAA